MLKRLNQKLRISLLCLAAFGLVGLAAAKPWWMRGSDSPEQDFLPPDVAFRVTSHLEGEVLQIRWLIADGYFLYRSKIQVRAESPDLIVGAPLLPEGIRWNDKNFGLQEVYFQQALITVPVTRSDFGAHPMQVQVTYQGCAQAGFCYPPISKVLFPEDAAQSVGMPSASVPPSAWVAIAILGGSAAFVFAGFVQRKRRRLPLPAL